MSPTDADLATSIAIPTYNGAVRIGAVLDALARQDVDGFEVIVVDNNSTDDIVTVVATHPAQQVFARRGIQCRVVPEPRQGLAFARIRGVHEARGRFVCFLDDDTVPDPWYVREGSTTLEAKPDAGVLVSRLRPRYEAPVPPSISRREHLFAINYALGEKHIDFGARPTFAPTLGGGLWVRRDAFLKSVPWATPDQMLPDRIANRLISGNDIEIGYLIGRSGFSRIYCPALGLEHRIPAGRLQTRYFLRLIEGIVRSTLTLQHRYGTRRYTVFQRLKAAGELMLAGTAVPFILFRRDGAREALWVLARRWAEVRGPYRYD